MQSLSCHGFRQIFGQELGRFWSKLVQDALDHLQNRDWSLLIARKWFLDCCKMAPRWFGIKLNDHMVARAEQWRAPRCPRTCQRKLKVVSRSPQEASRDSEGQEGPKRAPRVPKMSPDRTNMSPNCSKLYQEHVNIVILKSNCAKHENPWSFLFKIEGWDV